MAHLRVLSWNVEHNGIDRDGARNRRELALKVMSSYRPHIVLRQELTGADARGRTPLYQEASRLGGLIPFLAPATPESPNPTGIMVDPGVIEIDACHQHVTNTWHPICNVVVRIRGARQALSLASVHLCSYDGQTRATEAKRLTILGAQGRTALFAGDFNSYPHRTDDEPTPLPDWSAITDPVHYEHRTVERAGQRVSDTVPDEILAGGPRPIFTDVAHHAGVVLGQPRAMEPTAHLGRDELGATHRIDRMYCSPAIAPAIVRCGPLVTDEVRQASDHAPVVAEFDLAALREVLA